jgi:hypothetical protein
MADAMVAVAVHMVPVVDTDSLAVAAVGAADTVVPTWVVDIECTAQVVSVVVVDSVDTA